MLNSKNSKETHKFCLLLGGVPCLGGYPVWGGTLWGGYPVWGGTLWGVPCLGGTLPGGYPAGGVPCQGVPCWGVTCWGGGTLPGGSLLGTPHLPPGWGGPTSVVSKLQLSSSAVSWPYIALCPMELWVMLQSIMGVKKKIMGWVPPVDKLTK